MKRLGVVFLAGVLCFGAAVSGCGQKKAASPAAAIDLSRGMATIEAQANYLVAQAKAFYNSEEFQNAIDLAQYVLKNLDKESEKAKEMIAAAEKKLRAKAKKAVGDINSKLQGALD